MYTSHRTLAAAVCGLALILVLGVGAAAQEDDAAAARKDRILANLKLQFPQLGELNVTMGDITPSGFEGLDQGTFVVSTPRGQQSQNFLVSADDTKLWLVSGQPLDVSKSKAEIDAELAKRAEEEAAKAAEARAELASSSEGLPMRGNPEAPVTIVEFSDFQCPFCARGAGTVEEILAKYGDDVKFVFRHFPLGFHPWARPAAIASRCAAQQKHEAFWTLHDKYFADQGSINPSNVIEKSKEFLAETGIDMDAWSVCAENQESEEHKAAAATVDADMAFGQKLGVSGTPGFFVNGRFVSGAQPLSAFEPLIAEAKNDS